MGTFTPYPQWKLGQHTGDPIDFDGTDDIRYFIVTSSYTYNAAHNFVDDLTNHVTGTGAPGTSGAALANETCALDGTTLEFGCDDIAIAQNASGFSNGRTIVFAKWTGTNSTSRLIGRIEEASDFGNVAGDLDIDVNATTGYMTL